MRLMLKLVFTFLLFGMSAAYAQSVDEAEARTFHMSSRGSPFGVQAEFEGTYRVYDSSIEINVSKASLYVVNTARIRGGAKSITSNSRCGIRTLPGESEHPVRLFLNVIMSPQGRISLAGPQFLTPKAGWVRFNQALACGRDSGRRPGCPER